MTTSKRPACKLADCNRVHYKDGWCQRHAFRVATYGEPEPACTATADCLEPVAIRGLCTRHHRILKQYGHPLYDLWLDAAPLIAYVAAAGGIAPLAIRRGYPEGSRERDLYQHQLERARETGRVSEDVADRFCLRLIGVHPLLVFGDAWLAPYPDDVDLLVAS